MWSRSAPVDGFRLAFDRFGRTGAPPVVLLHGWPGNRHDYRRVVPLLGDIADVVVPYLRGWRATTWAAVWHRAWRGCNPISSHRWCCLPRCRAPVTAS